MGFSRGLIIWLNCKKKYPLQGIPHRPLHPAPHRRVKHRPPLKKTLFLQDIEWKKPSQITVLWISLTHCYFSHKAFFFFFCAHFSHRFKKMYFYRAHLVAHIRPTTLMSLLWVTDRHDKENLYVPASVVTLIKGESNESQKLSPSFLLCSLLVLL